ncbi:very long chain fatty acid elongase AAEL008004 isoform X1 [Hydra vulgaris]|uniref:very long chain fatty acid elongase AAEL008004 isoform X1 n=1 Tax=Hydra vulgaris TaxID=6087 RepID=UPI000192742E|nr:elongation of very long chain fatty acids protein AAEL008004 [Hydra vulgaris]
MLVQHFWQYYFNILDAGDSRTANYLFVRDPKFVMISIVLYLTMVFAGPKFMRNRKALNLRMVLIIYNFLSVLFSIWMLWEFLVSIILDKTFNLLCQHVEENDTRLLTIRLIDVHWWYFFSKFLEFIDTFFFVVRKKNNQISFLHTYHHVSMLLLQWGLIKFAPGGASTIGPIFNTFIHAVMYTYYMLAAVGPHMQKYLWWKKYLTRMQMGQFILIFAFCANSIYACQHGTRVIFFWIHLVYMVTLFMLFSNFYQTSYNTKNKQQCKED